MYKLVNSAVMPEADGIYESRGLNKFEFCNEVQSAVSDDSLESYIGYAETASLLSELTSCDIEVNRTQAVLQDGDVVLVAKLNFRPSPGDKGEVKPTVDDFEFRKVIFHAI